MSEKNIIVFTLYYQRLATLTMWWLHYTLSFRLLASTCWLLASTCPSTVAGCRSRSWCHLSASSRPVVSRAVRLRFSLNFVVGGGLEPPAHPGHPWHRHLCVSVCPYSDFSYLVLCRRGRSRTAMRRFLEHHPEGWVCIHADRRPSLLTSYKLTIMPP